MKMRRLDKAGVITLAALGLSLMAAPSPSAITNAAPTKIIAPVQAELPPVAAEVLRMSKAGISDDVITTYVRNAANSDALDADQIVYLRDEGISSAVLNALTAGSQSTTGGPAPAATGTTGAQNITSQATPAAAASSTPVGGAADNFYNALAPYGTWMDVPDFGWCWQPTVVVVNPAWQPYCNDGCWLWTDQGWYWNSYYAWGWAAFHYGRWCRYPGYGWLWCPDDAWGPAWVCWRDYPGYCGWAPLPPGACFTAGPGWTFNGVAVGFDFGFGLGPGCFTFCDFDDFCRARPFEHFRHGRDADRFFHDSRVNNNFAMDSHHHVINRGIDPSRIESATHKPITQVAVRELPGRAGHAGDFVTPDRLTRSGSSAVIYRPGRDISAVRNPFLPGRDAAFAGPRGVASAARGFTGGRAVDDSPRFQPARPNGPLGPASGASRDYSRRSTFDQPWSGGGNFQVARSLPPPAYHSDNSRSWRSAPARTPAPSPSWRLAPNFSRPASSSGGTRSWGGGARFDGGTHFDGGGARWGGGMTSSRGFRR